MNRRIRLLAAIGIACVLSTFMAYTALAGKDVAEPVVEAFELDAKRSVAEQRTVQLVGVAAGPIKGSAERVMHFAITDSKGKHRVPVDYSGSVPDAFKSGRNVVVTGQLVGGVFVAKRDTLVTKCPSKFQAKKQ
jgi:cytochrome c-type biogenesis protein CcmE